MANSTGEAVVQYFSGQTNVQPEACGSIVRMEDDNSLLVGLCQQWGRENRKYYVGKWGVDNAYQNRLYNHPAFVAHRYHWLLLPGAQRMECDDRDFTRKSLSTGDFWNIFVR